MSISVVQETSFEWTTGTTVTATLGSGTTSGNSLIVRILTTGSYPQVAKVELGGAKDNFGKSYEVLTTSGGGIESFWTDPNCAGGQTLVKVTFAVAPSTTAYVYVYEVSGLAYPVVDKVSVYSTGSDTVTSHSTATTSTASELVLGLIYFGGKNTPSVSGNGYTNDTTYIGDTIPVAAGYLVVSSTGAQSYTGTQASAYTFYASVVTFQAGSAPSLAVVQHVGAQWSSGTTITATLPYSTTAGNSLVVMVNQYISKNTAAVQGITLGGSRDNFVRFEDYLDTSKGLQDSLWIDSQCASGQTSVVATLNDSSAVHGATLWVYEISGLANPVVDQIAHATGAADSVASGTTSTTTSNNEILLGFAQTNGNGTLQGPVYPWLNDWTFGGATYGATSGYQVVASESTYSYTATQGSGYNFSATIVTLTSGTNPPITMGQSAREAWTSGTTITATLPFTTRSNSTLVVLIVQTGSGTCPTISSVQIGG